MKLILTDKGAEEFNKASIERSRIMMVNLGVFAERSYFQKGQIIDLPELLYMCFTKTELEDYFLK